MKTFFNILYTQLDIKDKHYPDDPFNPDEPSSILIHNEYFNELNKKSKCFLIPLFIHDCYYLYNKGCTLSESFSPILNKYIHAKYKALGVFLDNTFIEDEYKEMLWNNFEKAQRTYFGFKLFAYIYKLRKNPIIVHNDLCLNPLDINDKNTFYLLEQKTAYLFTLNDLINIIETAICNAPYFYSEPLVPLNPYNNVPLSLSTLYNIYFKMKSSIRLPSTILHLFFLANFDLQQFSLHNESVIREYAIHRYINNSTNSQLYTEIIQMLRGNMYSKNIHIDESYPMNQIVSIFKPFLYYYYVINYDIKNTVKITNYTNILNYKLKKFYEYNKFFGRKFIKITRNNNKIIQREFILNTKHIPFYNIPFIPSYDKVASHFPNLYPMHNRIPFVRRIFSEDDTDSEQTEEIDTFSMDDNNSYNTEPVPEIVFVSSVNAVEGEAGHVLPFCDEENRSNNNNILTNTDYTNVVPSIYYEIMNNIISSIEHNTPSSYPLSTTLDTNTETNTNSDTNTNPDITTNIIDTIYIYTGSMYDEEDVDSIS